MLIIAPRIIAFGPGGPDGTSGLFTVKFPNSKDTYISVPPPGSNSAEGLLSLWLKVESEHVGLLRAVLNPSTTKALIQYVAGQGIEININSAVTLGSLLDIVSQIENGVLHWLGFSWKLDESAGSVKFDIAFDGVFQSSVYPLDDGGAPTTIPWASNVDDLRIGQNWDPVETDGEIGEYWLNTGTGAYLDLSNPANIAKFFDGTNPVDLGANGENPLGSPPQFYFSAREGDGVAEFLTNRGALGNATEVDLDTGTLSIGAEI